VREVESKRPLAMPDHSRVGQELPLAGDVRRGPGRNHQQHERQDDGVFNAVAQRVHFTVAGRKQRIDDAGG
jgi:hypothetical protein